MNDFEKFRRTAIAVVLACIFGVIGVMVFADEVDAQEIRIDSLSVEVLRIPVSLNITITNGMGPYYEGDTVFVSWEPVDGDGNPTSAIVDVELADSTSGVLVQTGTRNAYVVPTRSFTLVFRTSRINGMALGWIDPNGVFDLTDRWGMLVGDRAQGCAFPMWDGEVLAASSQACADGLSRTLGNMPIPVMRSAELALQY